MPVHQATLSLDTPGPGTQEITESVAREVTRSGLRRGVVAIFCQHTSCSLVIMTGPSRNQAPSSPAGSTTRNCRPGGSRADLFPELPHFSATQIPHTSKKKS